MNAEGNVIEIDVTVHPRVDATAYQETVAEQRIADAARCAARVAGRGYKVLGARQEELETLGVVRLTLVLDAVLRTDGWRELLEAGMAGENFLLDFDSAVTERAELVVRSATAERYSAGRE